MISHAIARAGLCTPALGVARSGRAQRPCGVGAVPPHTARGKPTVRRALRSDQAQTVDDAKTVQVIAEVMGAVEAESQSIGAGISSRIALTREARYAVLSCVVCSCVPVSCVVCRVVFGAGFVLGRVSMSISSVSMPYPLSLSPSLSLSHTHTHTPRHPRAVCERPSRRPFAQRYSSLWQSCSWVCWSGIWRCA